MVVHQKVNVVINTTDNERLTTKVQTPFCHRIIKSIANIF